MSPSPVSTVQGPLLQQLKGWSLPPPPGIPFQFMLICSYAAFNGKASACVSVTHTVMGAARSLPESAPSAHREVSGNLCSPKGGLWPMAHECVGIDGLGP